MNSLSLTMAVEPNIADRWNELPVIDLRHVLRLSDDTGLFQHAMYATPDPHHGYCIDDNNRALIAAMLDASLHDGHTELPIHTYIAFIRYAFNSEIGCFRNFMQFDRRWMEEVGSQDSQARSIWALGVAIDRAPDDHIRAIARDLLNPALDALEQITSIRSCAFIILGLQHVLDREGDDDTIRSLRDHFAARLLSQFETNATADWPWWEPIVAYDNAKLPHGLLVAGRAMKNERMIGVGLSTLKWLLDIQTANDGHLSVVGNHGWFTPKSKGGKPAGFDQQPLDAYAMVHACLAAASLSQLPGDEVSTWEAAAWQCFDWFTGRNDLDQSLYDESTGGCFDGLQSGGVNRNQGAESTLAYLLSVLELHDYAARRSAS